MATLSYVQAASQTWDDAEIVERVRGGETALFELLIRRHNQRLYRIIRSIVRDDDLAEEVMQEAYVRAFEHLRQFEGRASFSTWLSRIAVNEALARLERRKRFEQRDFDLDGEEMPLKTVSETPETSFGGVETRELLEKAILALPRDYRSILVMRDVEELTTSETASVLGLTEENVKVRLHRAHAMLRRHLTKVLGASSLSVFQFGAARCDRVTDSVMQRIMRFPQTCDGNLTLHRP